MTNILIRNVPESVIDALKKRAADNRRSFQQEVITVLEAACKSTEDRSAVQIAAAIRSRLAGSGRSFSDSTESVREDRER